jgi:hypothetical protein
MILGLGMGLQRFSFSINSFFLGCRISFLPQRQGEQRGFAERSFSKCRFRGILSSKGFGSSVLL